MSISVVLSDSSPLELSVFSAAQSAMSTMILTDAKVFDLSRLTLIRFCLQIDRARKSDRAMAQVEIAESKRSEAGMHYLVNVEIAEDGLLPWATVEFEIIDRKRGLKTAILHNLTQPEARITDAGDRKIVDAERILEEYPHLRPCLRNDQRWPFELLLLAGLDKLSGEQGPEIQINYHVFGAALSALPCEIIESKSLVANPGLIEIIQGNVLIAQLK